MVTACIVVLVTEEKKKNAPNSMKRMAMHALDKRRELPNGKIQTKLINIEGSDMTGITLIEQALVCILGDENK